MNGRSCVTTLLQPELTTTMAGSEWELLNRYCAPERHAQTRTAAHPRGRLDDQNI